MFFLSKPWNRGFLGWQTRCAPQGNWSAWRKPWYLALVTLRQAKLEPLASRFFPAGQGLTAGTQPNKMEPGPEVHRWCWCTSVFVTKVLVWDLIFYTVATCLQNKNLNRGYPQQQGGLTIPFYANACRNRFPEPGSFQGPPQLAQNTPKSIVCKDPITFCCWGKSPHVQIRKTTREQDLWWSCWCFRNPAPPGMVQKPC